MSMDIWKYYGITHTDHRVMNPISQEKVHELVDLLRLTPDSTALDIGCGKAEFLCLLAEKYGVNGIGVDCSPVTLEEARGNVSTRRLAGKIELVNEDGAAYCTGVERSFELVSCMGASWVFGGLNGTLQTLKRLLVPGGLLIVGEPFWRKEPDPEFLADTGHVREAFNTHAGNIQAGQDAGLAPLYACVADQDDWDRYEGLQWQAAHRYSRSHPDDPDVPELLGKVEASRRQYLQWGRDSFGWAIYLFARQ